MIVRIAAFAAALGPLLIITGKIVPIFIKAIFVFRNLARMLKTTAFLVRSLGKEFILAELKALAIPIALLAAGVALGLFIDDLVTFLQGHDSVIGRLLGKYKEWRSVVVAAGIAISAIAITALAAFSPLLVMMTLLIVAGIAIARVWTPINEILDDLARNIVKLGNLEAFKLLTKEVTGFIATENPIFRALKPIQQALGGTVLKGISALGETLGVNAPTPAPVAPSPSLAGVLQAGTVARTPLNPLGIGRAGANVTVNQGPVTITGVDNPERIRSIIRQENDSLNRALKRNLGQ